MKAPATSVNGTKRSAYLAPLRRTEWVVYAKRPFGGPQAVLAYLSRYTHRVIIALGNPAVKRSNRGNAVGGGIPGIIDYGSAPRLAWRTFATSQRNTSSGTPSRICPTNSK